MEADDRALFTELRGRLAAAALPTEVIAPLQPEALRGGRWAADIEWPVALRAGLLEEQGGYRARPENLVLWRALREVYAADGGQRPAPRRILDLGCGSGSLLAICWYCLGVAMPPRRAAPLCGIDISARAIDRARRSFGAHRIAASFAPASVCRTDSLPPGTFDLVVTNPPWFPAGWGRPSDNPEVHRSTHEVAGDVSHWMAAAASRLAPSGRVLMVYAADQMARLFPALTNSGLAIARSWWIDDQRRNKPIADRIWLELTRGTPPSRVA